MEALKKGTGLRFNQERANSILDELEESESARLLHAELEALGYSGAAEPIHTAWLQKPSGRLYAAEPPVVNLPRLLRSALESIDGGIVCEIDYQNFEPRILHAEAGVIAPEGD